MKKNYLKVLLIAICATTSYSQTTPKFFGVSFDGAPDKQGIIYNTDTNGTNMKSLDSLSFVDNGTRPSFQSLVQAANGKIYGVTTLGGANDEGTLFEYDPVTEIKTIRHHFANATGYSPYCSLLKASNGKLYGTTQFGGTGAKGTMFEFDPTTNIHSVKANFNDSVAHPLGKLVQTSTGNIYGVIKGNGNNTFKDGSIYKFDLTTNTITAVGIFLDTVTGRYATGLTIATNGKMYGMTITGGTGNGIIFEFDPTTNTLIKKVNIGSTDGRVLDDNTLFQASNGKFYGTTYSGASGAGSILEYNLTTNTLTRKQSFTYSGSYAYPKGNFIESTTGTLMLTFTGGQNTYLGTHQRGRGSLSEYNIAANTLTPKHWFYEVGTGAQPSEIMKASNGKFYGITNSGGAGNFGTIYEYDRTLDTLIKKHDFSPKPDGGEFAGRMLKATNGKMYGVTKKGGLGYGTIYEFDPVTNSHTKLADFDNINGKEPLVELIQGTNGKLYGVTNDGGDNSNGTLFEFDITTNIITVRHHLSPFDGAPTGSCYQATNGKFYYVNQYALYSYDLALDTVIYVKGLVYGVTGNGYSGTQLLQANDGNLYFATNRGGLYNYGALVQYSFSLDSLISVPIHTGVRSIYSQPLQASNGKLYMPSLYSKSICEYTLGADTIIQKKVLATSSSFYPTYGQLIEVNGKLFGTAHNSTRSLCYMYNYDLTSDVLNVTSGVIKGGLVGGLIEGVSPTVGLSENEKQTSFSIKVYPNPTSDYISFNMDKEVNEIKIYNMSGQLIAQPNPSDNRVEVANFDNGVYVIQLFTESGVAHSRFIKQ